MNPVVSLQMYFLKTMLSKKFSANSGSFLLIPQTPRKLNPPVRRSSEIIIELIPTTNQIVVFYN